jgi:hypothetical protein
MLQQRRLLEDRLKQIKSFEERLADDVKRLREEAKLFPSGAARDYALRQARQAETGSHMSEWLRSPSYNHQSRRCRTIALLLSAKTDTC